MRHRRAGSPVAIAGVALALLFALPSSANARKLQMSGTWALRTGQLFVPLQFAASPHGSQITMTSMGNLSKGFFFPQGPIPGAGIVTETGGAPQALVVPRHRFVMNAGAAAPLVGWTLVQITTMFAIDAPHQTAMLQPGGGPGSFTWCPSDPACTDPPGPDPPPGGPGINGRIVYRAGASQFGGTLQLGLAGSGLVTLVHRGQWPPQFAHHYLMLGPTDAAFAVGAAYATTVMLFPTPGVVSTYGGYHSSGGLIVYPGPLVTTMGGLTTSCAPGCGPLLVPAAVSSTQWGFPATTGTVLAQQTTGTAGDDFFTVMGSDMRTLLGAGNISLVAGGLTRRNAPFWPTSYAVFQKVWMTLAAPTPSLSPAGIAAAAALVLLAAAYALRRRFGGSS